MPSKPCLLDLQFKRPGPVFSQVPASLSISLILNPCFPAFPTKTGSSLHYIKLFWAFSLSISSFSCKSRLYERRSIFQILEVGLHSTGPHEEVMQMPPSISSSLAQIPIIILMKEIRPYMLLRSRKIQGALSS